jgi:hypothetical protein
MYMQQVFLEPTKNNNELSLKCVHSGNRTVTDKTLSNAIAKSHGKLQ